MTRCVGTNTPIFFLQVLPKLFNLAFYVPCGIIKNFDEAMILAEQVDSFVPHYDQVTIKKSIMNKFNYAANEQQSQRAPLTDVLTAPILIVTLRRRQGIAQFFRFQIINKMSNSRNIYQWHNRYRNNYNHIHQNFKLCSASDSCFLPFNNRLKVYSIQFLITVPQLICNAKSI